MPEANARGGVVVGRVEADDAVGRAAVGGGLVVGEDVLAAGGDGAVEGAVDNAPSGDVGGGGGLDGPPAGAGDGAGVALEDGLEGAGELLDVAVGVHGHAAAGFVGAGGGDQDGGELGAGLRVLDQVGGAAVVVGDEDVTGGEQGPRLQSLDVVSPVRPRLGPRLWPRQGAARGGGRKGDGVAIHHFCLREGKGAGTGTDRIGEPRSELGRYQQPEAGTTGIFTPGRGGEGVGGRAGKVGRAGGRKPFLSARRLTVRGEPADSDWAATMAREERWLRIRPLLRQQGVILSQRLRLLSEGSCLPVPYPSSRRREG